MRLKTIAAGLLCLTALLLASCASHDKIRHGEARECADSGSPACIAARHAFQREHYTSISQDRLLAASSRALGDLNFETTRDDAQAQVRAEYVATAPTHKDQLDERFRKSLRNYAADHEARTVRAQLEVRQPPDDPTGQEVHLLLYAGAEGADDSSLIDNPALYQIFFNALGIELGAAPEPLPTDKHKERRKMLPMPSMMTAPTGSY
ncbi:MAG: hypothetical protein JWR16_1187 [Nevskia sp.]|nr:hypothetical protein [Nevskia sp.]